MKQIDVTKDVMMKVASYERKGISVWLRWFIIATVGIVVSSLFLFFMIISDLLSKRAFDLFELFSQDPEIISEFWQEVLSTFWEEIPRQLFLLYIMMIIILITFIILTRKRRLVIQKKFKALDKYS